MRKLTDDRIADIIKEDSFIEMDMRDLKKIKQPSMEELYEKLNRYERIEEELELTFEEMSLVCKLVKNKKFYDGYAMEWLFEIDIENKQLITNNGEGYEYHKTYYWKFSDHKKTWWLREDKSE